MRAWRSWVTVAVVEGSVEAQRLAPVPAQRLLRVPDARAGAAAVQAGVVDALALSLPTVRLLARDEPGLRAVAVADGGPPSLVAVAFRADDPRLLQAWDAAQRRVLGSAAHLQLVAGYGFAPEDIPAAVAPPGAGPR
jgi:polar amino acid transport system substrate-binding protein